ncbi:FkbM family methyltransferase [Calothrix sp. FACHB-1219]|uniref:FkbM family methyltransferase n=1 Tax=unclassified Calothrix TaxID=2619626 RepID=UPI001684FD92|nr:MULTISPECIES: FkbM family methyltransferase [unclassified Calothrix]MBD2203604.1 FkbM family methyltransferase [Calothrix sp. FACHB-168]MBD2219910.1 FkbM family methyltransferase [Calothrix sp. FACHB-1219]
MDKNLIIDVGVHTGQDTEFYLKKGFKVVGVEANPEVYKTTKQRLNSYIETGQLTLLNVAISSKNEPLTFYANLNQSIWGTISPDWAIARERSFNAPSIEMTVQGCTFENILQEYGIPYYLKIDIECADLLCVKALRQFDSKPQFLSIESTKSSWKELLEEFALLQELGYQKFKVINQAHVLEQVCPSPALEGKYIPHQFEYGSSGLFGEETPGNWLSYREILKIYQGIFWTYRIIGVNGIIHRFTLGKMLLDALNIKEPWYDTHASL